MPVQNMMAIASATSSHSVTGVTCGRPLSSAYRCSAASGYNAMASKPSRDSHDVRQRVSEYTAFLRLARCSVDEIRPAVINSAAIAAPL